MRKLFGAPVSALLIMCLIVGTLQAGEFTHPKKYGFEITLGGGYYLMDDVNDFIPDAAFIDPFQMGGDEDKINIGNQLGFGFIYRNMDNFGWVFGYNRLNSGIPVAITGKYRINAFFKDPSTGRTLEEESWVEQSLSGRELYAMPTWYFDWNNKDISLSMGPALYRVKMDRSIAITRSFGSGSNATGSFAEADGSALGLMISAGIEFPISEKFFFNFQAGGRLANIGKLTYDDNQGVEQTVWLNNASNATMSVDFTGGFAKASIRTYFTPTSDWRSPRR